VFIEFKEVTTASSCELLIFKFSFEIIPLIQIQNLLTLHQNGCLCESALKFRIRNSDWKNEKV
jgi:hypothetical protein